MKTAIALFTCIALFAIGAWAQSDSPLAASIESKAHGAPVTRPASNSGSMVNDVRIELALFGSGTHLADVTDRVIQLLRTEPQGFTAKIESLHIDPVPGKNKSLLIRYRYHDQERLYLITGGNRASYASLIEDESNREH